MKYVVDTSVINKLVDGDLDIDELPSDGELVATHIQLDELNKTKDPERRFLLFHKFHLLKCDLIPTEIGIIGKSRIGHCKIGDGRLHQSLKQQLDLENSNKRNNIEDALIIEVAIKNHYNLLTADYHMDKIAKRHDCIVIKLL